MTQQQIINKLLTMANQVTMALASHNEKAFPLYKQAKKTFNRGLSCIDNHETTTKLLTYWTITVDRHFLEANYQSTVDIKDTI